MVIANYACCFGIPSYMVIGYLVTWLRDSFFMVKGYFLTWLGDTFVHG